MHHPPHVVFAGGGTHGHLHPGLAVAERLVDRMPHVRITFAGSGKAWERLAVVSAGHEYIALPCRPMPKRAWQTIRFISDNFAGFWAARWLLRELNVSLVVGLGGYVSAPMVRAAQAQGLKNVLLEQNAIPGRATRFLAGNATMICSAFPELQRWLKPGAEIRVTGNPLRSGFTNSRLRLYDENPLNHSTRSRKLVVLGGSLGAKALNEAVPRAVYKMHDVLSDWQIVHQTGSGQVSAVQQLYQKLGIDAFVVSFIDNLPDVLRQTDLAICRAGGTTLAELAAMALPAIVVPFAEAADNHQLENAKVLAQAGACKLLEQNSAERLDDQLAHVMAGVVACPTARRELAEQIAQFAKPNASDDVAAAVAGLMEAQPLRIVA